MALEDIRSKLITKINNFKLSLELFIKTPVLKGSQDSLKRVNQFLTDFSLLKTEVNDYYAKNLINEQIYIQLNDSLIILEKLISDAKTLVTVIETSEEKLTEFNNNLNEKKQQIEDELNEISGILNTINLKQLNSNTINQIVQFKNSIIRLKNDISDLIIQFESISNQLSNTDKSNISNILTVLDKQTETVISQIDIFLNYYSAADKAVSEINEQFNYNTAKTEEIKWKAAVLSDLFNSSQLKGVNSAVQQTLGFLNNIDSLLSQAQEFVEIIKLIESSISDPLTVMINKLAEKLKGFVTEFKSTGVYVLDMFEYAYIGETRINEKMKSELYNLENSKYKDYIRNNYIENNEILADETYSDNLLDKTSGNTNPADERRLKELKQKESDNSLTEAETKEMSELTENNKNVVSNKYGSTEENKRVAELQKKKNTGKITEEELKELENLSVKANLTDKDNIIPFYYRWKAFTYEEWIETIAEAFLDEMDLPDGALVNGTRMNRAVGRPQVKQGKLGVFDEIKAPDLESFNKDVTSEQTNEIIKYSSNLLFADSIKRDRFKSGRPQFGNGSISKVAVLMISAPDITGFLVNLNLFMTLFSNTITPKNPTDWKITYERWKKESDAILGIFPTSGTIIDNEAWNDFLDTTVTKNRINSLINSGTNPDFYGVSLYSLMPELFNNIESIFYFLKNYYNDIPPLFSDQFDSLIQSVKNKIQMLKNFSKQLQNIIKYLTDILNTSISILVIDSDKGNEDIYEKLLEAKNAPGQDTGREMFYGGLVLAYGFPDINKINETFDINGLMKEMNIEWNEKTNDLNEAKTDQFNAFDKIIKGFK